ncbi:MAG: hypothetical protein FWD87_00405 [Spirochaetaceae bacterium]|nr:hypothetical protein [Spirochaetaceae bacterium]
MSGADIADENNADTTITLSGDATIRAIFHRTFPDTRSGAGQTYRIVRIGELEWMAENLRFAGHSTSDNRISWCYSSNTPNHVCFPVCSRCNRYGRMYNYLAAAAHNAGQPRGEMSCPPGWRLPVCREWDAMRDLIGTANAGNILKSREGWNQVNANGLNGSDRFGFSALPGGLRADTQLEGFGVQGRWWSATSGGSNSYRFREMRSDSNQMTTGTINRNRVLSVRCVRD